MDAKDFCPHCGEPQTPIDQNGHLQCSHCGKRIDATCDGPCCQTASARPYEPLGDPDE